MIRTEHLDTFDICLTTRAPLFIGSGKSYGKKEYVFLSPSETRTTASTVMLLDENKLFSLLVERNLIDRYETFMLGYQTDLYRFLTADCRLSMGELRSVTRYSVDAADALDADHSFKEIFAFVRDGNGSAYIPGSSLKGALRTAILTEMLMNEDYNRHSPQELRDRGFEGKYLNTLDLRKDRDGNRMNDAVNSILQGIRLSDSEPIPDSAFMLAGKIDADINGETHSINLCRECVRPGTEIRFRLTIDRSVVGNRFTGESLAETIRQFDRFYEYVWVQNNFVRPRQAAEVSYENALLLGGGSGYGAKTLVYPYLSEDAAVKEVISILSRAFSRHHHERDEDIHISPRVMKYARYRGKLYPYGLCEVSIT